MSKTPNSKQKKISQFFVVEKDPQQLKPQQSKQQIPATTDKKSSFYHEALKKRLLNTKATVTTTDINAENSIICQNNEQTDKDSNYTDESNPKQQKERVKSPVKLIRNLENEENNMNRNNTATDDALSICEVNLVENLMV